MRAARAMELSQAHLAEQKRLQREKQRYDDKVLQLKQQADRYRVLENTYVDSDERRVDVVRTKKKNFALRQATKRQEARFAQVREQVEKHKKQVELYDSAWNEKIAERIALRKAKALADEEDKKLKEKYAQITERMMADPTVKKNKAQLLPAYMETDTYRGHPNALYESMTPTTVYLDRELSEKDAAAAKRVLLPTYTSIGQLRNEWRNAKLRLHGHLLRGKEIANKLQLQFMQLPPSEWIREECSEMENISTQDADFVATKLKVYGDLDMLQKHWDKLRHHLRQINIPAKIIAQLDSSWLFHMNDAPDHRPWGGREVEMQRNVKGMISGFSLGRSWAAKARSKVAAKKKAEADELKRRMEVAMRAR